MLPRRNQTNPYPGYASSRPTSSSFGDGQPLRLITNQKIFRANTIHTVETDSPQSETFQQDTPVAPLVPRRPSPAPELPPRNNFRRQSTRRNTYETFGSALESPLQSRPPVIMPMPIPQLPHSPVHPPLSPIRSRQPAPGEGVGGFTYSSQYTGDRYRLDAMSSPRSDSGPPHYKPADVSGGIHANVWPTYNKISQEFDQKKLEKWNKDLDLLLIFVSHILGFSYRSN